MNKSELIEVAAKKAELTQSATAKALNAILEAIVENVAKRDDVVLVGFGTFKASDRSARTARNPRTGDPLKIPATTVPKFSAGSNFKAAVASAKKKKK